MTMGLKPLLVQDGAESSRPADQQMPFIIKKDTDTNG
jgi:hypothetical protein